MTGEGPKPRASGRSRPLYASVGIASVNMPCNVPTPSPFDRAAIARKPSCRSTAQVGPAAAIVLHADKHLQFLLDYRMIDEQKPAVLRLLAPPPEVRPEVDQGSRWVLRSVEVNVHATSSERSILLLADSRWTEHAGSSRLDVRVLADYRPVAFLPMAPAARDRILSAADKLFYGEGIHAVSVDDVVDRAKTAKTTVYLHFSGKEELVATYLAQRHETWREHVEEELRRAGGSPEGRIDTLFAVLAAACQAPGFRGCPFINATAELPDRRHQARTVVADYRAWLLDLLTGLAREAKVSKPTALARQLVLLYDAAMVGKQFEPSGDAEQQARAAARQLLRAARKR
jgi:AcrR family transcriptional regulator